MPTAPSSAAQVTEFCRGERKQRGGGGLRGSGWCVVTEGQSSVSGVNAAFRRCRKVLYREIWRGVDC